MKKEANVELTVSELSFSKLISHCSPICNDPQEVQNRFVDSKEIGDRAGLLGKLQNASTTSSKRVLTNKQIRGLAICSESNGDQNLDGGARRNYAT